jgi:hypothetical protein
MLKQVEDAHVHPTTTTTLFGFRLGSLCLLRSSFHHPALIVLPTRNRPSRLVQIGVIIIIIRIVVVPERESTKDEFDQRDPERPDIALDRVISALDSFRLRRDNSLISLPHHRPILTSEPGRAQSHPTHTHIRARPHKRIRDGIDQFTRYAEITDLDIALRVDEDIRGLDVYMRTYTHTHTCQRPNLIRLKLRN